MRRRKKEERSKKWRRAKEAEGSWRRKTKDHGERRRRIVVEDEDRCDEGCRDEHLALGADEHFRPRGLFFV